MPFTAKHPLISKIARAVGGKVDAWMGRLHNLDKTLGRVDLRPPSLNLEFTNLCNANCTFCGYQHQERAKQTMTDEVFAKALSDYAQLGGGDVYLTPIVGDALIDKKFLDRVRALRAEPSVREIRVITNAILLDRFGMEDVVRSGLTGVYISTSGFDRASYERLYRSTSYTRMRDNVLSLLETRDRLGVELDVTIGLRTDRPLSEAMRDPDFQPILKYNPRIDFTWKYVDFGGRIKQTDLTGGMQLRSVPDSAKREACKSLYDGPTVLPDGQVSICSCASAMDGAADLGIGNILAESLGDIWRGAKRRALIDKHSSRATMNPTCATCTSYRNLDFYRSSKGRWIARENQARANREDLAEFNQPGRPRLHD